MRRSSLAALGALALLAAPAAHAQTRPAATPRPTAPTASARAVAAAATRDPSDPFEGINRRFFALNSYLDRVALRPVALAWKNHVPAAIRSGVRNFISNLSEPVVFANDVLQGRATDASISGGRFVLNSTVGVGGLFDVGKRGGLPRHDNNFGTTLARDFGAGPGAYVYLPLLGPTSVRDGIGTGVDTLFNPLTWVRYDHQVVVGLGIGVVGGVNARADFDDSLEALRAQATDEYATLRSLYLQNRAAAISGKPVDVNALPDFDDPGAPGAAPGSVAPTGGPPRATTPGVAPSGDAGALPRPAGGAPGAGPPAQGVPQPTPRDEEGARFETN